MKAIFSIIALSSVSLLSADQYGYGSCPNGNCQNPYYNSQGGYQGQNYRDQGYRDQNQGYRDQPQYQGQSNNYRDYQGYRQQSQPQGYYNNPQQAGYNQRPQDGNYNRNDYYQRNQNAQYQGQDDQGYYNPKRENVYNNDNQDSRYVSDVDLNKEIKDLLAPGMFSKGYPDVRFEANNGNVMLTGTVENLDDRAKLEDIVRKVKGVKNVNNQVTTKEKQAANGNSASYGNSNGRHGVSDENVRKSEENYPQDTAATDADRQLNARIREKISDGWFVRKYEIVTVRTNNGVVTLVGFVDSNDDIKKINDKLKEVDGVRSVNNQLNVKNK